MKMNINVIEISTAEYFRLLTVTEKISVATHKHMYILYIVYRTTPQESYYAISQWAKK